MSITEYSMDEWNSRGTQLLPTHGTVLGKTKSPTQESRGLCGMTLSLKRIMSGKKRSLRNWGIFAQKHPANE